MPLSAAKGWVKRHLLTAFKGCNQICRDTVNKNEIHLVFGNSQLFQEILHTDSALNGIAFMGGWKKAFQCGLQLKSDLFSHIIALRATIQD